MAESERPTSTHPIGRTITFDGDGEPSARTWVICPHTHKSAHLEGCAGCIHLKEMVPGTPERADAVACYAARSTSSQARTLERPLRLPRLSVSDLMTRNVVCVRMHLSLDALALLFLETGLRAVPVVDAEGHVLGMVSNEDVQLFVQSQSQPTPHAAPIHAGQGHPRDPSKCSVADVMLPLAYTITEHASVTELAALLVVEAVQRVTVVSGAGEVVGVISASDVLHWLANEDGHVLPARRQ